jgi:hypothetical protein
LASWGAQKLKIVFVLTSFLVASHLVLAQSTGTITGRVVDSTGGAVAGSTLTATNTGRGVTRTTATNSDGLYTILSLQPGIYDVKAEMTGFNPSVKNGVTLITDTALTVDFSMGVAGVNQQVEVSAEAAMTIETTQSEVAGSSRTSEVQNLPVLNRNFTGLVTLVPGARPAPIYNTTKASMGPASIAIGGGTGHNVEVNVDGADNKDDMIGGPLQNYTLEGIQEFKLLAHEYGPQYGRTNGAIVQLVTKSGTNQIHGTAFAYGRNDAMTAIDYFTKQNGLPKTAYGREQFGGSLGGPIKKDRWFFFGAYERVQQNSVLTFAPAVYNQAVLLAPFVVPAGAVVPSATINQPFRDNLYTLKTDYQISSHHSLFVRFAQQINHAPNDQYSFGVLKPDIGHSNTDDNNLWSIVGSETWVIGSHSVNQFTFQSNNYHENILDVPFAQPPVTVSLTFPAFSTGRAGGTDQIFTQLREQFKDDFSHQIGNHALKFGGDFSFYPKVCICTNIGAFGAMSFFDDPAMIINNKNGKYPQGFKTPGIVSAISVGTFNAGGPIGRGEAAHMKQLGLYIGDDWKIKPSFTVNLGLRYDREFNFMDQSELANNRTYLALKAIGSPFAVIPRTPSRDFGPRAGFAWDIGKNAKNVLRASFGIFWDEAYTAGTWQSDLQNKSNLQIQTTFVNTAVRVGQLANYVYGVSPLPTGPPATPTQFPVGGRIGGFWIDPKMTDPYNEQAHIGYTHQLTASTVVSADYTHILGIHEFRNVLINPLEGSWDPNAASYNNCGIHPGTPFRRLQCAFGSALGDPNILAQITLTASQDRSQYNEFIVHFEHRSNRAAFQASYTLSTAYGFGGSLAGIQGSANSTPVPQNVDRPFGPGEWGPGGQDERHRLVLSGVFSLPWGMQASPIFQVASARPYNLTAGRDCNADGQTNDRAFVDPSTGAPLACNAAGAVQVAVNSQRGDPTYDLDARVTKFFNLGKETRKLGFFAEFYNITNKSNFGNVYNGNAASAAFKTPVGYLAGLPTSRQLQLGARFSF